LKTLLVRVVVGDDRSLAACGPRRFANAFLIRHNELRLAGAVRTLPFGHLWYAEPNAINNAVGYAKFYSRSHNAVIRVYDETGNIVKTEEHAGNFREP
jgi:hypothetical protein